MLIAADDALTSAAEARYLTSKKVDKKLREVIDLLSCFERDFKDSISGQNIGGEAESKSASMVLHALRNNLHAKVKCSSVFSSLFDSLNIDECKPMGNNWPEPIRIVEFHILRSLPDAHPIVVKRGYNATSIHVVLGI